MLDIDVARLIHQSHPIVFGVITVASIIEMSISAWITAQYNSKHNSSNSNTELRVRFILFSSLWTIVFPLAYIILFQVLDTIFIGTVSHIVFLTLTWIIWVAAATAITTNLGGTLDCNTQSYFEYCGQLNAMMGFSWAIWSLVTIALILILCCGIRSAKRGYGFSDSLIA